MKSILSLPEFQRISHQEFLIARTEAMASALKLRLIQALSDQQFTSLRSLTVVVRDGEATVAGEVESYYHRQVAVNACQNTWGLRKLIDQIEVCDEESMRHHCR